MRYTVFDTVFGCFGGVAVDGALVATYLPQSDSAIRRRLRADFPEAKEVKSLLPGFRQEVVAYFKGDGVSLDFPVNMEALTTFRVRVLKACRRIPPGATATYQDLARAVGSPGAARAVGGAMAANPIPLVIPCHRVLRTDGSLGGFSSPGSVGLKRRMLALEQVKEEVHV